MLHPLPSSTQGMLRPQRFTFPYRYTPHPLCVAAAEDVRAYLKTQPELEQPASEGKMFGVLVVEKDGALQYLAAYSGELAGSNHWSWFVPPIYDLLAPDSYFQEEQSRINALTERIKQTENCNQTLLKQERKARSQALQQWLFRQYRVLNAEGSEADFIDIFQDYHDTYKRGSAIPPSGSGECCAPKLLQAAYLLKVNPVCMAEFWVGRSPRDEIRIDGHYYPACSGRCKPILSHMLRGLDVEDNPMLAQNRAMALQLKVLHAEASFAVVDKPSGMLAIPGNDSDVPTVLDVIMQRFPEAKGPVIVHRLDMDTSGLMVVAFSEEAYHNLQRQFVEHSTEKRYVALLEKEPALNEGTIDLPLCPNPYDRPRQMVSEEYGKRSVTHWKKDKDCRVFLWPHTGRTHQLRVHCAHSEGLDAPIVGDPLYGTAGERLCLHADSLSFNHPLTGERLSFHSPSNY